MCDVLRWLRSEGGTVGSIRVTAASSSSPRGVFASKAVRAGEVLLSVPSSLLLTAGTEGRGDDLPEADALILRLLSECESRDSRWDTWLRLLPGAYEELPSAWEEHELEALHCPQLIDRARAQRSSMRERTACE